MVAAALDDVTTGVVQPVAVETILALDDDPRQDLLTTLVREQDAATEELLDPGDGTLDRDAILAEMRRRRRVADAANKAISDAAGAAFVADVDAALDAQRTPADQGAPKVDALMAAVDAAIRQRWGPLPWVRYTRPGRVLSVNAAAHTCKVRIPDDATPGQPDVSGTRTVRTGVGLPQVGKTYAVHFPYRLPDAPTSLLSGPVPAGDPWLKAPGGTTWLYYDGRTVDNKYAWYRVPLPPPGDTSFQYADSDATLVAVKEGTFPTWANWGGEALTGVTQTYAAQRLWMEDAWWPNDVGALRGDYGVVRPYRSQLRTYPQLGVDPANPAGQDGAPLFTSYPWLHLAGSALDFSADADYLLGFQYELELLAIPADNPGLVTVKAYNTHIEATNSTGGATWIKRSTGMGFHHRNHFTFDDTNGYHAGFLVWIEGELLDAAGWVGDTTTQWWQAGQRVSYWAVSQLTPAPFPNPNELIPLSNAGAIVYPRFNASPARVRVWIAVGNGSAAEVPLPGQPAGWVSAYPAFFLRPTGGVGARAWWAGMPTFIRTQPGGPGTPIVNEVTPVRLWRGTLDLQALTSTWVIKDGGLNLNIPLAVNQDASIIAAAKSTNPVGSTPGSVITYLSQDAGETWTRLPAPPHVVNWGLSQPRMRLIDTP